MNRTAAPLLQRIFCRVLTPDEGCWEWIGGVNRKGYGRVSRGRRSEGSMLVHRAVYELALGPVPAGKVVMHTCDNRRCARPSHLRLGTIADNNRDMAAKQRAARQNGSANGRARLALSQVQAIRAATAPRREVAVAFGVAPTTVRDIQNGRRWRSALP